MNNARFCVVYTKPVRSKTWFETVLQDTPGQSKKRPRGCHSKSGNVTQMIYVVSSLLIYTYRNLSFSYPGSQSIKPAISNISLSIKPGQLVVIVGGNGSGKSTIIKLLTRLYDPASPPESILVDGLPLSHYRMSDLRQAMATLTQDHTIFPLSLGENIGLGCVQYVSNDSMIDRMAEMGGAKDLLDKLEKGKDTVLPSRHEALGFNLPDEEDHPLHILLKQLQKTIELSGGEKQRVVAYALAISIRPPFH